MQARYVYTGGAYREFRGHVFTRGNPVTISDRGTLDAIARLPEFIRVSEETKAVSAPEDIEKKCPKCGKLVMRGRYMHVKYCKGAEE